jgi:N6-L-threonylcarbamoyladenine synthase
MPTILGIESTCDETGASVVVDGRLVLSNAVASQVELHEKYRGVVPEIASRAHIENILPVLHEALAAAGCTFADVDAIAVAHRPGLIGSLLIGVTAAKTLAWSLGKPLIGVDHVQAHLYSVMLEEGPEARTTASRCAGTPGTNAGTTPRNKNRDEEKNRDGSYFLCAATGASPHAGAERSAAPGDPPGVPAFPAVGLVVSGGHTSLYDVRDWTNITRLGSTIDDAVGEAYDKVAAILGLGYPGGPILDRLAAEGDPGAVRFPRTLLGRESLDFSFSGLKTAVLYHVRGVPGKQDRHPIELTDRALRDVAASFQAACVDVIVKKLQRAIRRTGAKSVIVGGGVSANRGLRAALKKLPVPVHVPPMQFCTDNAAMTAGLADVLLREGRVASLDLDAITSSAIR